MSALRMSLLLLFAGVALSMTAAPAVLLPGRWQITIRPELPLPAPEMTTEVCVSRTQAERLTEPPHGKPTDDCRVTGGPLQGNVLSYSLNCAKRKATTRARFTYNGDRYDGVVEGEIDGRKFRQVYTAIRLGDCPDEPRNPLP